MKMLRERKTAVLLTVAIAAVATLIGVYASLRRLTRDVEDMFYSGVYIEDQKYTEPSIYERLKDSAQAALNLATLLKNRPELADEAEALLSAQRWIHDAKSISALSEADAKMAAAFTDLLESAKKSELTVREIEAIRIHQASFSGAHLSIADSAYNEKTEQYSRDVSLIAKLISIVLPVKPPQRFMSNAAPIIWVFQTDSVQGGVH